MNYYRLYGREKGTNKRFKAIDLSEGVFVDNLIYATFWDDKEQAKHVLQVVQSENEWLELELRKC